MKTLKQLALLPLFFGLVLTTACSENYDNGNGTDNGYYNGDERPPFNRTITAEVVNGNNYDDIISSVVAVVWPDSIYHIVATGTWSNGGFTITLPETINADFLIPAPVAFALGQFNISDTSARFQEIYIYAYDDRLLGSIVYACFDVFVSSEEASLQVYIAYVDRDVTITGGTFREIYNLQLRAGWNWVYRTTKMVEEARIVSIFSTEPISGLRWYFQKH